MDNRTKIAQATLKALTPYQWLFVKQGKKGVIATYAVSTNGLDCNNVLFYHSVDLLTGESVDEGYKIEAYLAIDVLRQHYNKDMVRLNGLVIMQEVCAHRDGLDPESFPEHIVFGTCIEHEDVDELDLDNGECIVVI